MVANPSRQGPFRRLRRAWFALPPALALLLGLYLLIAFAMVFESTRTDRMPFESVPEQLGLAYEEVTFTPRGEDLLLSGWFLPGSPEAPFLIFVHGIDSQRTGVQAMELAARLVRDEGYNVLLFDLRAHGTSEGRRVTAGERERYDVLGAYHYLLGRGAQAGKVGLLGRSYGAGIALMAAALEPGIAAVMADSPFTSVKEKAAHEVALRTPIPRSLVPIFTPPASLFADLFYGIHLGDLRPVVAVSDLAYPVFVVHGEADTRTPVSQGRRVFAAAPPGSQLWTLPGVEHAKAFQAQPEEYVHRVASYFASRLDPRQVPEPPLSVSELCFGASALPDGFVLREQIVLEDGTRLEHSIEGPAAGGLRGLYQQWGRLAVVERAFVRASGDSYVSCKVEVYGSEEGAREAFDQTGLFRRPLEGMPEHGTFRELSLPAIGAASKHYLQLHATSVGATVLFRTGAVLGRVDVLAGTGSAPGAWPRGEDLIDYAGGLAVLLLDASKGAVASHEPGRAELESDPERSIV